MLKKGVFVALFGLGLFAVISAQSGRRIKPKPTPKPTIKQEVSEVGYSESSPSSSISIFAKKRTAKKPNLKKKGEKEKPQPEDLKSNPTEDPDIETDDDLIKVESALITVPVAVYTRQGIYVSGLTKENFKIFEDGVEQEVAYFGLNDKPFTVILVLDLSGSTVYKIEDIRNAARAFVDQLNPADSVMVIAFDSSVNVLTKVTNDREKIYKAINRTNFGGGTALYDAVATSLGKRLRRIEGRKAIVLFTDGVDTGSFRASYESTIRDADEVDAQIFPIYYNTFLNMRGLSTGDGPMTSTPTLGVPGMGGRIPKGARAKDYAKGRQYLRDLAALTGGRVFRPDDLPGGLNAAFEGIAAELRTQYNIGYYPLMVGQKGERKEIRVRVNRPKLAIRARDSYIVGSSKD